MVFSFRLLIPELAGKNMIAENISTGDILEKT